MIVYQRYSSDVEVALLALLGLDSEDVAGVDCFVSSDWTVSFFVLFSVDCAFDGLALLFLKSVTYHPLPFSWNPAADMRLT